jgi:hypothetical protein
VVSPSSAETLEQAADSLAKLAAASREKTAEKRALGPFNLQSITDFARRYPEVPTGLAGAGLGAGLGLASDFSKDPEERAPLRSAMTGGMAGGLLGLGGGLAYHHGGDLYRSWAGQQAPPAAAPKPAAPRPGADPAQVRQRQQQEYSWFNRPGAEPPIELDPPPAAAGGGGGAPAGEPQIPPELLGNDAAIQQWHQQQRAAALDQHMDQLPPGLKDRPGTMAAGPAAALAYGPAARAMRPLRGRDLLRGVDAEIGDMSNSNLAKTPAYAALQGQAADPATLKQMINNARKGSNLFQRHMPELFGSRTPVPIGTSPQSMPAGEVLRLARQGRNQGGFGRWGSWGGAGGRINRGLLAAAPWLLELANNQGFGATGLTADPQTGAQ